jgi:Flp pilus assembly protein TadD
MNVSALHPFLFVTLALIVSSCSPGTPDQGSSKDLVIDFRNIGNDVDYVGDVACASCHEEEYHSFQNHGMARTMERLTDDVLMSTFPSQVIHHQQTNLSYQAFEEDGRYFQLEFRLDAAADTVHSLTREMTWVIGSGTIARTYLTVENGLFTEMPLTWYTQRNTWDFSPGYEVLNNRFDRAMPDRCVACHNAYPETVEHVSGRYTDIAEGISCERCHGPGDLHVNTRLENPEPASDIDLTIVNPKHLPLDVRMDVCQQCHVTATVSILREDREAFDFVPTEMLESHVSLFSLVKAQSGAISVASHAKQLKRSACFINTAATASPVDCVTCHNPHVSFRDAGPDYINAACEGCHDSASLSAIVAAESRPDHESGANCNACHMPKADVSGVPHSAFTDHWIRVVGRTNTAPSKPSAEIGSLSPYFEVDRNSPDAAVYEGVAYIVLGARSNNQKATGRGVAILEDVLTDETRFGDAHYQLGFALFTLDRLEDATRPLEVSVRLGPDVPERLNTLAQLYERLGRSSERIEGLYQQALEVQPLISTIRVNYGRFLETQGRLAEAGRQYEIALEHHPSLAAAHYNLGTFQIREGDFEQAEDHFRRAILSDPDYSEAYGNLGVLLVSQQRKPEARTLFERGVDVSPEDPVALNNLASFYLNEGMDSEAAPLLRKAVSIQPDYVDALSNLALASIRLGDDSSAAIYAAKALALDPENVLAIQVSQAVN